MAHTFYEGEVVRCTLKKYSDHPFFTITKISNEKTVIASQMNDKFFNYLSVLNIRSIRHTEKDNKGDI
jgi:hypothetical protein